MPTYKQKQAFENIIKNKGNVSKSMREAGYKENTAHNPRNLTNSKGFKEIWNSFALSKQQRITELNKNIKQDQDKGAKNKALDMSFKIDGDVYPKEEGEFNAGDFHIIIKKE